MRTVSITGNAADYLTSSIIAAFQETLDLQLDKGHPSNLLGLQHPFVPLRKVHRSPTLRFLSPGELSSPTLWTADFLNASVFMHLPSSGLRRLYITDSAGYTQIQSESDLTWSKMRELPRYTADSSQEVREADALEKCWEHYDRLDGPQMTDASFSSGLSYHSSFDSHMLSPRHTNAPSEERNCTQSK